MVGQNHVRAVADEQIFVDAHASGAQRIHFFDEGKRVEHDPVANYAAAALTQHAAGNELKDELLAMNRDRVSGVVAAGVARYDLEPLRENVNNFAFAFVAPLRADDDRCPASFQLAAPSTTTCINFKATAQIRTQLAVQPGSASKIRGN